MTETSNLIGADELSEHLEDPGWRTIDCRFDLADPELGARLYRQSHIPGAVFADLDRDLAAPVGPHTGRHPLPEVGAFETTLGLLGIDNSTDVVVYDAANGAVASRAWWLLRWAGHDRVRLLDGGLQHWVQQGFALRDGAEQPATRRFVVRPRRELVVTTEEIPQDPAAVALLNLIDARDAARFRGDAEPIDPVAGHIPGAINLPLAESLNEDGTWKTQAQLRSLWRGVLGDDKAVPWAVMCGSGVTACHLALSGVQAGYAEPRVYVGSWSEWIRNPERPVALGHT